MGLLPVSNRIVIMHRQHLDSLQTIFRYVRASLMAQIVKNLPAVRGTRVRSLGGEDPLKEGMATHSSILAWRIPWTEEPHELQSMRSQTVEHD